MKIDFLQFEALLAVVDEGTFEGAAAVLQVTPSAISQRIKALEQHAGKVLLQRSKPVKATDAAIPYLQAARQIQAVVEQTLGTSSLPGEPAPAIPLAANADSLDSWLISALASVADIASFRLYRDDQDHTAELLRAGKVMAGVASHAEPVQGCESTRLGVMRYLPVASPDYVVRWLPNGLEQGNLAVAPVVHFDRKDTLQKEFLNSIGMAHLNPPHHYIPSNLAFNEAIVQDMCWGMVPELLADPMIGQGAAIHLGGHVDVTLYWQQWKISSPQLDALRTAVVDAAAYALRI